MVILPAAPLPSNTTIAPRPGAGLLRPRSRPGPGLLRSAPDLSRARARESRSWSPLLLHVLANAQRVQLVAVLEQRLELLDASEPILEQQRAPV
jgi:hypothetical protein